MRSPVICEPLSDSSQFLVGPNRGVLELPRVLARGWRSLPFQLPCESLHKWTCDHAQSVLRKLGILPGSFCQGEAIQLRVDLKHSTIIRPNFEAGAVVTLRKVSQERLDAVRARLMLWL